ncbi:MAG: hypothetical protein HXY26_01225 [Hydrogenophilaceae bacterium]|nr:hypothetical protein [Hydrogenophilaceae bacterium]
MKKLYASLVLVGLVTVPSLAAAADSPHSLSGNVSLTSNYVFRGISQTSAEPAIQGGLDYTHSSGIYLGTWASNVNWLKDYQGYDSGSLEIDLYGGYRGAFGDISYDVGAITYIYPGDKGTATTADTSEVYAAVGWKWFTVKYSYAISDEVFGFANADGSDYWDLAASVPLGDSGFTAGAHWGTFSFDKNSAQDYDDWKLSLTYDMGKLSGAMSGVTVGVAYTDTNAKKSVWTNTFGATSEFLGDSATTVWISKAL